MLQHRQFDNALRLRGWAQRKYSCCHYWPQRCRTQGLIEMADSQPPANKTSLLVTLVPTPMGYAAEKSTT